jgi:acyl-CoA synthetase (AMP-forming)/AMP-acid ligase II
MRETTGRNAPEVAKVAAFSQAHGVDLRTIELDVLSQDSVDAAVAKVIVDTGHIDALVHNAGHMVFGRPRPSRRSISPSYMTSTCSAPSPLDGSVIRISVCGSGRPTVETQSGFGSERMTSGSTRCHCFHTAGCGLATLGALQTGGVHGLSAGAEPGTLLELLEAERGTHMLCAPTILLRVLDHPGVGSRDLSSWRLCTLGGAPVALELVRRAQERLGVKVAIGYGQTEVSPYEFGRLTSAMLQLRHHAQKASVS